MSGLELANAAEGFLGASFRLHGRDPLTGFDCVGLVLFAMAEIGRPVHLAISYGLRNLEPERFFRLPEMAGFHETDAPLEAGDVLLLAAGPAQLHLAIVGVNGGIVHAHAGLRRVVHTPFPLPWPVVGHWRLRAE
jgi:cell wall-associated NlpC family hydrolase